MKRRQVPCHPMQNIGKRVAVVFQLEAQLSMGRAPAAVT
jgi:hypothetical protein